MSTLERLGLLLDHQVGMSDLHHANVIIGDAPRDSVTRLAQQKCQTDMEVRRSPLPRRDPIRSALTAA
jgi:hypothetical protein